MDEFICGIPLNHRLESGKLGRIQPVGWFHLTNTVFQIAFIDNVEQLSPFP